MQARNLFGTYTRCALVNADIAGSGIAFLWDRQLLPHRPIVPPENVIGLAAKECRVAGVVEENPRRVPNQLIAP